VDVYVRGDYLLSFNVGKKADIKVKKNTKLGKRLLNAVKYNEKIELSY